MAEQGEIKVSVSLAFPIPSSPEQSPGGKIYAAMGAVMKDMQTVGKDKTNQDQGFKYRGVEGIYNAAHDSMTKHGVFSVPRVIKREVSERKTNSGKPMLYVVQEHIFRFFADDGSFLDVGPIFSEGMDLSDKASNKCLSMAHKYALIMSFCIPTEDIADGDKETLQLGDPNARPAQQRPAAAPRQSRPGPQAPAGGPTPQPAKPQAQPGAPAQPEAAQGPTAPSPLMTFWNAAKASGWTEDEVRTYVKAAFQKDGTRELPTAALNQLTAIVQRYTPEKAMAEFQTDIPDTKAPAPDTFGAFQPGAMGAGG